MEKQPRILQKSTKKIQKKHHNYEKHKTSNDSKQTKVKEEIRDYWKELYKNRDSVARNKDKPEVRPWKKMILEAPSIFFTLCGTTCYSFKQSEMIF